MHNTKHTPESIEKMRINRRGKCLGSSNPMFGVHRWGEANPNYGRKHTPEEIELMSINRKGKGTSNRRVVVKYSAIHQWVYKNKPFIGICELCNTRYTTELACITRIYERDIDNFKWSCHSCNQLSDIEFKRIRVSIAQS